MRTNRANYLSNLPTTDNLSSKTIHAYKKLLEDLIMTSDNTNDEDLIDFKKKFIIYIINNFNKYGIDYLHEEYFPIRKNLCLLREDVIKNNIKPSTLDRPKILDYYLNGWRSWN